MSTRTATRTVLITGASSGFGLLTSVTLALQGWQVLATMRDLARQDRLMEAAQKAGVADRIECLRLDVTSQDEIDALVAEIANRNLHLDALVNNAGFAMAGFVEDVAEAELRRQFDTNFFAHTAVTRAFLPQLRRQGHGHVVMISSISGRCGFPGIASYAASKHALEGWTESLRYEMSPLGIQVVLVEPGSFATDIWTRNTVVAEQTKRASSPNADRVKVLQARLKRARQRPDAQIVASGIARILAEPKPRLRYVFGSDARMAVLLRWMIPSRWFEAMIARAAGVDKA